MTDQAIQHLILKELRQLRSSFEAHKEDTGRRLSTLETQVSRLVDGSPGPGPVLVAANQRTRKKQAVVVAATPLNRVD
jgi:hypothetical protein